MATIAATSANMCAHVPHTYFSIKKPAAFAVLCALKSYANKYLQCFPSHSTLAKDTNLTRRSVIYALNYLKNIGFVDWHKSKKSGIPSCIYSLKQTGGKFLKVAKPLVKASICPREKALLLAIYKNQLNGKCTLTANQLAEKSSLKNPISVRKCLKSLANAGLICLERRIGRSYVIVCGNQTSVVAYLKIGGEEEKIAALNNERFLPFMGQNNTAKHRPAYVPPLSGGTPPSSNGFFIESKKSEGTVKNPPPICTPQPFAQSVYAGVQHAGPPANSPNTAGGPARIEQPQTLITNSKAGDRQVIKKHKLWMEEKRREDKSFTAGFTINRFIKYYSPSNLQGKRIVHSHAIPVYLVNSKGENVYCEKLMQMFEYWHANAKLHAPKKNQWQKIKKRASKTLVAWGKKCSPNLPKGW